MGQLCAELDFTSVASVLHGGLHEYLDRLQAKMNAIDTSLRSDFAVSGIDELPPQPSGGQSQRMGATPTA